MTKTNQKGFTLVELLVVIGIIAALAAVVIPNVARFVGSGDAEANNTERQTVQAAIDLAMADNALTVMPDANAALTGATVGDFLAIVVAPGVTLFPDYLRQDPVKCDYAWDADGQVLAGALGQVCP